MDQQRIWSAALAYLARREHSAKELRSKLIKCGFTEDLIKQTVEKCISQGLQSDQRYSEMLVKTRMRQGYGPLRIRQELEQRGVSVDTVELSISCENWQGNLHQVKEKKFGKALPANYKEQARQIRFLMYRGFEMSEIMKVYEET